jgi:hypothetical protein
VTSRGVRNASSRPLPPLVLLLLAAVAVALGPAVGLGSGPSPWQAARSATRPAAFPAARAPQPSAGIADPSGERAELGAPARARVDIGGDERDSTTRPPVRVGLRHSSAAANALERPTFDAVLPAAVVAGPLGALAGGYGATQVCPGLTLPRGSARSPPASLA